ncbi:encapsulin [Candidatus Pacearchaeota archaeon]|nr:encapsulin [Candidatus Pacearchaeota archaeon]
MNAYKELMKQLARVNGDTSKLRHNSLLTKDAWKRMDTTFLQAGRNRLVGVGDLMSRGLKYDLGANGFAVTVFEYETVSNEVGAELSMSGRVRGNNFEEEYTLESMPMPIISKFWELDARTLASSKQSNRPLDTAKASQAGKAIAEKKETILFNGTNDFTYGGGTIYGYTDFPDRETTTIVTWIGATMAVIIAQILNMKQASLDNKKYGPWILYIPSTYEVILDKDYDTVRGTTLRDRILQIGGIQAIQIVDVLATDNILLVNMDVETVRMVIGQKPTVLSWDIEGGSATDFYGMEIAIPQIRADADGNCGVIHGAL